MPKPKILLVPFLAISLNLVSPLSVLASSEPEVFISEEVGAWGTTPSQKRTGQQEAFLLADQLDSDWVSSLDNLKEDGTVSSIQTAVITPDSPNVYEFLSLNSEVVTVSAQNVDMKNIEDVNDLGTRSSEGYQYKARLDLPGSGANTYNGNTMQDFAPIPSRFTGEHYANESQNGFGDQNSYRNGLLFSFSQPLQAFGVWVGDLETRTDGFGTAALLRLFGLNDEFLGEHIIPPNHWITEGEQSQSVCGTNNTTTDLINKMGCGHNTTRFIGFSSAEALVLKMLIIVGDDDNFADNPEDNNGNTEHISFIGPVVAFFQPQEALPEAPQDPEYPDIVEVPVPIQAPTPTFSAYQNTLNLDPLVATSSTSTVKVSATSGSLAQTGAENSSIIVLALSLIFFSGAILLATKQSRLNL
jgi:hypothetical protein